MIPNPPHRNSEIKFAFFAFKASVSAKLRTEYKTAQQIPKRDDAKSKSAKAKCYRLLNKYRFVGGAEVGIHFGRGGCRRRCFVCAYSIYRCSLLLGLINKRVRLIVMYVHISVLWSRL